MLWLECLPEPLVPQRLYWPMLHAAREGDAEARRTKVQMMLRQVSAHPGSACPAGQAPLLYARVRVSLALCSACTVLLTRREYEAA